MMNNIERTTSSENEPFYRRVIHGLFDLIDTYIENRRKEALKRLLIQPPENLTPQAVHLLSLQNKIINIVSSLPKEISLENQKYFLDALSSLSCLYPLNMAGYKEEEPTKRITHRWIHATACSALIRKTDQEAPKGNQLASGMSPEMSLRLLARQTLMAGLNLNTEGQTFQKSDITSIVRSMNFYNNPPPSNDPFWQNYMTAF